MRRTTRMGAPAFRDGFTLVEMLVVFVIIGLAFVLVAPSLVKPRSEPGHAQQRVVDGARRLALRRAEAVTLSFAADGHWIIQRGADLDAGTLRDGTLDETHGSSLRLRISPLGACTLVTADPPPATFDTVRCRLTSP